MKKEDIRKRLFALQDLEYRAFQCKLIPNIDINNNIGTRTPDLKRLAKELYLENDYDNFLNDLPHKYFDENQLHAFIISLEKDYDRCIKYVESFLPYIDNWATCDQLSPKVFKKHSDDLIDYIKIWIQSDMTYVKRFAIGMLLQNFLDDNYNPLYLKMVSDVKSNEYYVNMMVAWYFSVALVKQYNDAIKYIENKTLSDWIHNKTIQKALESCRIEEDKKEYLRKLKIK